MKYFTAEASVLSNGSATSENDLSTPENLLKIFLHLQYFVAVLVFAALAQATPIEYGHYGAPALVHAPIYHAPIAKHVVHAEPIVN